MPKVITSILSLADSFETIFLDMYGVIWNGNEFYPSVFPLLQQLKEMGKKVIILSNASQLGNRIAIEKESKGLLKGIHYDEFLTSGDIFFQKIQHGFLNEYTGKKDYLIYSVGFFTLAATLPNHITTNIEKADILYFGSMDSANYIPLSLDPFIQEIRPALNRHLKGICVNPDYYALRGNIKYYTAGALALWYEEKGEKVYYMGKPYIDIYNYAFQNFNINPQTTLMVGDTLRTDIKGANNAGIPSVLITSCGVTAQELLSGKTLNELEIKENAYPDFLLDSIK